MCVAPKPPSTTVDLESALDVPRRQCCDAHVDSGEGRLELDELGHALGAPTRFEVVTGGSEPSVKPRRYERLNAGLQSRRWSRVITSALIATVIGVGIVATVTSGKPPPVDHRVRVSISAVPGDIRTSENGSVYSSDFRLADVPPTDSIVLMGVVGPGVRSSHGSVGSGATVHVSAVINCDDAAVLTSDNDQYSLVLSKTDQWHRSIRATAPLPRGAPDWASQVRRGCLDRRAEDEVSLESLSVTQVPDRVALRVRVVVRNTLPLAARVGGQASAGPAVNIAPVQSRVVLPGKSAIVVIDIAPTVCWAGTSPATFPAELSLQATSQVSRDTVVVTRRLTSSQLARIDAGLRLACTGAPQVTVSLTNVGKPFSPFAGLSFVPITLAFGDTAVADVLANLEDSAAEIKPRSPGPGNRLRLFWPVLCQPPISPLTVTFTLPSDGRRYPASWTSTDRRLRAALVAACPKLDADTLTSAW